MGRLPFLLIVVGFAGSLAACGDGDESGRAGDPSSTFAVGAGVPDTIASTGTDDPDTIAADLHQTLSGLFGPDATYDSMIEMWSDRCRSELDLETMREFEDDLFDTVAGVEVVDVTIRRIDGPTAQAEIISTDAEGVAEGALVWGNIVLEDGHWRADDCQTTTTFQQAGRTIEAPVTAPLTDAEEEDIARSIEAQYLGRGAAADAWDFLSTDCRDIEWAGNRDAHDAAFGRLGPEIAGQDVTFAVEDVTLELESDTVANASLTVVHNGLIVQVTTDDSLRFEYESGGWRYDECSEPDD